MTGDGTVLSGLSISGNLESPPTTSLSRTSRSHRREFGIGLTHTAGVTIANSTISGQNSTTGRVSYAIDDVYGDSTGMTIKGNNISNFRTAVQISTGLADGNYIHDPGYLAGDHTNGFYVGGGTQPLTIQDNTILNSLGQTDAINLDACSPGVPPSPTRPSRTTCSPAGPTPSTAAPSSGSPTTTSSSPAPVRPELLRQGRPVRPRRLLRLPRDGNTWSGNTWDTTGQPAPPP